MDNSLRFKNDVTKLLLLNSNNAVSDTMYSFGKMKALYNFIFGLIISLIMIVTGFYLKYKNFDKDWVEYTVSIDKVDFCSLVDKTYNSNKNKDPSFNCKIFFTHPDPSGDNKKVKLLVLSPMNFIEGQKINVSYNTDTKTFEYNRTSINTISNVLLAFGIFLLTGVLSYYYFIGRTKVGAMEASINTIF